MCVLFRQMCVCVVSSDTEKTDPESYVISSFEYHGLLCLCLGRCRKHESDVILSIKRIVAVSFSALLEGSTSETCNFGNHGLLCQYTVEGDTSSETDVVFLLSDLGCARVRESGREGEGGNLMS